MKVAASLFVLCAGCLIAFGHPRSAGAQIPQPSQAQAALQQAIQQQPGLADMVRSARTQPSDVFGVDVFQRTTTQFLPLLAGPVPADYRLGPGDNLVLILTGDVELSYSLPVTREGFILIPQVGQVHVANLTLDQLRDVLYTRLGRVYSGVRRAGNATTRFDVTVANVRANQVYVVGEVAQPGAYQISSLGTVFTALYAAGGVTERARLRGVDVQRLGKTVATLDLYDYLLRGDTRNDIRMETGDVIFVPIHESRVRERRGATARGIRDQGGRDARRCSPGLWRLSPRRGARAREGDANPARRLADDANDGTDCHRCADAAGSRERGAGSPVQARGRRRRAGGFAGECRRAVHGGDHGDGAAAGDVSVASGDHVAAGHGARPRTQDRRRSARGRDCAAAGGPVQGPARDDAAGAARFDVSVRARFGAALCGAAGRPLPCGRDRGRG